MTECAWNWDGQRFVCEAHGRKAPIGVTPPKPVWTYCKGGPKVRTIEEDY